MSSGVWNAPCCAAVLGACMHKHAAPEQHAVLLCCTGGAVLPHQGTNGEPMRVCLTV